MIKKGDLLQVQHGPVECQVEVVEMTKIGAVIRYTGRCTYVGGLKASIAPNGTQLAPGGDLGFIGVALLSQYEPA